MSVVLFSVHLPKTAGTSFQQVLEQHFGACMVRDDDRPLHRPRLLVNACTARQAMGGMLGLQVGPPEVRALLSAHVLGETARSSAFGMNARGYLQAEPEVAPGCCVHGHFLPVKYRCLRAAGRAHFITWMREPIARLVSHFHYWQRNYNPATAGALHRRVVEERWSLERFCLSPELRNLYSRFLWGFPLRLFAFIGITEYFAEDVQRLRACGLLPAASAAPITPPRINTRPPALRPVASVNDQPEGVDQTEPALRARVQAFHARDIALYRSALQLRERVLRHSPLGFHDG